MNMHVQLSQPRLKTEQPSPPRRIGVADPLETDLDTDRPVVTSLRRIARVATLAAEVGTRFAREGIDHDPVAWLMSPRRLFRGKTAIVACQNRKDFLRGLLLHGLSVGLDAEPAVLDVLVTDAAAAGGGGHDPAGRRGVGLDEREASPARRVLYTALVAETVGEGLHLAFVATVTDSREAFERSLRVRLGVRSAGLAHVREGFVASEPLMEAVVSPWLADFLIRLTLDPSFAATSDLDVCHRQRLAI